MLAGTALLGVLGGGIRTLLGVCISGRLDETLDLQHRILDTVVNHHRTAQLLRPLLFCFCPFEPLGNALLIVATCAHPLGLHLATWGIHVDAERIGIMLANGLRSDHVDLEEHILILMRLGKRASLQIVQKLDPFEESTGLNLGLEGFTGREHVCVRRFPRTRSSGGPGATQPQSWIAGQQLGDNRAFSNTARTTQHNNHEFTPLVESPWSLGFISAAA